MLQPCYLCRAAGPSDPQLSRARFLAALCEAVWALMMRVRSRPRSTELRRPGAASLCASSSSFSWTTFIFMKPKRSLNTRPVKSEAVGGGGPTSCHVVKSRQNPAAPWARAPSVKPMSKLGRGRPPYPQSQTMVARAPLEYGIYSCGVELNIAFLLQFILMIGPVFIYLYS